MTISALKPLADLARLRHAELDAAIAAWRLGPGAGARIWCHSGCGNCCTLAVHTTLPEALTIADSLTENQRQAVAAAAGRIGSYAQQASNVGSFLAGYKAEIGACPFLDETANCSIYSQRPLACRALLATRPPDWCGINLSQLPGFERETFLASLDQRLVAFPTHYAATPKQLAEQCEKDLLHTMLNTCGFRLSGNLPLLVSLCGRPEFTLALSSGLAAVAGFLKNRQIDQPFLIQVDWS